MFCKLNPNLRSVQPGQKGFGLRWCFCHNQKIKYACSACFVQTLPILGPRCHVKIGKTMLKIISVGLLIQKCRKHENWTWKQVMAPWVEEKLIRLDIQKLNMKRLHIELFLIVFFYNMFGYKIVCIHEQSTIDIQYTWQWHCILLPSFSNKTKYFGLQQFDEEC